MNTTTHMKTCTKCKKTKPIDEFRPRTDRPGKHYTICNACYRVIGTARIQTPEGKVSQAWSNMYWRSENRDGHHPRYAGIKLLCTREEFVGWALPQYREMMQSLPDCTPTIDRLDPKRNYELTNMRVITHSVNSVLPHLRKEQDDAFDPRPSIDEHLAYLEKKKIALENQTTRLDKRLNYLFKVKEAQKVVASFKIQELADQIAAIKDMKGSQALVPDKDNVPRCLETLPVTN